MRLFKPRVTYTFFQFLPALVRVLTKQVEMGRTNCFVGIGTQGQGAKMFRENTNQGLSNYSPIHFLNFYLMLFQQLGPSGFK